jgi:hypothetical protein
MRSVYGKECEKHPELAGRRYLPNLACIKCHSIQNKDRHAARKLALNELIAAAIEAPQTPRLTAALKAMGKSACSTKP